MVLLLSTTLQIASLLRMWSNGSTRLIGKNISISKLKVLTFHSDLQLCKWKREQATCWKQVWLGVEESCNIRARPSNTNQPLLKSPSISFVWIMTFLVLGVCQFIGHWIRRDLCKAVDECWKGFHGHVLPNKVSHENPADQREGQGQQTFARRLCGIQQQRRLLLNARPENAHKNKINTSIHSSAHSTLLLTIRSVY